MITEPLVLVKTVRCTVDSAIETVIRSFEDLGFAVVSKLDIFPKTRRLAGECKRATLLRACYPKARCARYFLSQRDESIVRCSVLLQEADFESCVIEIARPVRLLDVSQKEVRHLVRETDWRLRRILSEFRADFLPDSSEDQSAFGAQSMGADPGTSFKVSN